MKLEMVHICIFILIGGSAIKEKKFTKKKYWKGNIKSLKYQTPATKPFEEFPVIDGDQINDPPLFDTEDDDREPLLTPKFRKNRIQTTPTQSHQLKNTVIEREMWSSKRPDFNGPNGNKKDTNNELWTTKTNIWGITERTQIPKDVDVKMFTSSSLVNMTNFMTVKGPNLSSTTQQATSIKMSSVTSSNSTQENKMSTTIKTMMSSVTTPTSPNKTSGTATTIITSKTDVDETGKPAVTDDDMTVTTTMETSISSPITDVNKKESTTQFLEGNDETTIKSLDGKIPSTEKVTTLFQDDEDRLGTSSTTTTIKMITTLDVENGRREPTVTMKTVDVDEPTKSEVPTLKMTVKTDKDDKMTTVLNEADTGPAGENIPGKFPVTTMKDESAGGMVTQIKPDEPDAENLTTIKRFLLDVTTESEIMKPKTLIMSSMDQVSSTPNEDSTKKTTTDDDTNLVVKTVEPTTMVKTQAPTTTIIVATATQKPLIATVKPTIKGLTTKEPKDIGWNREPLLKSGND